MLYIVYVQIIWLGVEIICEGTAYKEDRIEY